MEEKLSNFQEIINLMMMMNLKEFIDVVVELKPLKMYKQAKIWDLKEYG